jgi:hypothetical protein
MRREGAGRFVPRYAARHTGRNSRLHAAKRLHAVAQSEPQDPRRAALWKNSQSMKKNVERHFRDVFRERTAHALLERGIGVAKEVKGQVHAIGPDPRGFYAPVNSRTQATRDAADLFPSGRVDISSNK